MWLRTLDKIILDFLGGSYLNPVTSTLLEVRRRKVTQTEGKTLWRQAKTGVISLQAKDCQQPPEAGQGKAQIFLRGSSQHLDFGLLASRAVKK